MQTLFLHFLANNEQRFKTWEKALTGCTLKYIFLTDLLWSPSSLDKDQLQLISVWGGGGGTWAHVTTFTFEIILSYKSFSIILFVYNFSYSDWYIEDMTWWLERMNFVFEWKKYFIHEWTQRTSEILFHEKINFICSSQCVIFFYYIDMSVSKIKKN